MAPIIGWNDRARTATVTASSELSTLPATFVQTPHISQRWRTSSGTTSASLTFDLGAAYPIGLVVVRGTNVTSSGTWRVEISNDSAFGTTTWDSGTLAAAPYTPRGQLVTIPAPSTDSRYVRVTLAEASASYIEAGHVGIFLAWTPTHGLQHGFVRHNRDGTVVSRSFGDAVWTDRRIVRRALSLRLHALTASEARQFVEIILTQGSGLDTAVVLDDGSSSLAEDTYVGLLSAPVEVVNQTLDWHSAFLSIEERVA